MVHAMLMESDLCEGTTDFKETDLYKKCVAAGVIPDTSQAEPLSALPSDGRDAGVPDSSGPGSASHTTAGSSEPPDSDRFLSITFHIRHMWCPACAWVIEDMLMRSKGVIRAECNFSSDRGKIWYDPVKTSPNTLFNTIEKLGYKPALTDEKSNEKKHEFVRFFITLFLTMNVMMFSWAIYSGFFIKLSVGSVKMLAWPVFVMASAAVFYGGFPIHVRAASGIRSGFPGMEALISIGSFSTYSYSVVQLFLGSIHLYFDAASMLILLTLTGKMIEQSAKNRISQNLSEFFSLFPQKVKICTESRPKGRYVSVKQLSKGDLFITDRDEVVAADGVVIKGSASVDESSITGEAKPSHLTPGDKVKSGSRILKGALQVRAVATGDDSILGRMLLIMEENLGSSSAGAQRFANLLKYFVPSIIGLAVITCLFWITRGLPPYESFSRGISVLVISCPCALGIAIPLTLVAGVSAARSRGILVRDFEVFEKFNAIDTLVFDKTGTLTSGSLVVLDMITARKTAKETAWKIICAMEKESDHYIADTIRKYRSGTADHIAALENITHHPNGISCRYRGKEYRLGRLDFAAGNQPVPAQFDPARQGEAHVISTIYLTCDHEIAAVVHLGDFMKKGIKDFITDITAMGYDTCLISGDATAPVAKAGRVVQIASHNIHGNLLPHEKADFIKHLQQKGKTVAMIGDGVNDAPAMAQSDIAIAVRSGLNPSRKVATVTLMQETPVQLLEFIPLAKAVNAKVKQNLWFAFVYNLISIPIAAAGLLNPIIAVIAMLLSSLSVTLNTLRLVKRWD